MSQNIDQALADAHYVEEFVIDDNEGYEWSEAHIYSKDGHVFYLSGSGCSCNYWGEYYYDVNEAIGGMVEISSLNAARDLIGGYISINNSEYDGFVEAFRKLGLR